MNNIFIINLIRDSKKKRHMQRLCQKFNLQAEFIDAVDGRQLNDKFVSEIYSSEMAINEVGRDLSRGEIGCALSHKIIYQKMIDDNIETALILEDDIDFDEILINLLDKKEKLTANWELILLGHHTGCSRKIDTMPSFWHQKKLMEKYKLVRPCEKAYGTYGYLINKNGAIKLLKHLDIISKPIDHFTGDSRCLNLYTINPAPIKIHEHLSDNFHSMEERIELQKIHLSLFNEKEEFYIKKIIKYIGLYQFLINMRKYIIILFTKMKSLGKYQ